MAVGLFGVEQPANAICLTSGMGSNCNTFDPNTVSDVLANGFTGGGTSNQAPWQRAFVVFNITGAVFGITINIPNIKLTGDFIVLPITQANLSFNSNGSGGLVANFVPQPIGNSFTFDNSILEFDIESSDSFVDGTIVEYSIRYETAEFLLNGLPVRDAITSSVLSSTAVPGPFGILGLGAAYSYSRRLRKKIRNKSIA